MFTVDCEVSALRRGHAPVRIGELEVDGSGTRWAAVSEGFAEVNADKVVLMVDSCEFASDIDRARAERAKARAERELERLRGHEEEEIAFRLEEAALQRALIRIQVSGRQHSF